MHRHLGQQGRGPTLGGKQLDQRRGEVEPSCGDQVGDRHGREHLGHRGDPEPGARRVRRARRPVGVPDGVLEQRLARAGQQEGPGQVAGAAPLVELLSQGCEACRGRHALTVPAPGRGDNRVSAQEDGRGAELLRDPSHQVVRDRLVERELQGAPPGDVRPELARQVLVAGRHGIEAEVLLPPGVVDHRAPVDPDRRDVVADRLLRRRPRHRGWSRGSPRGRCARREETSRGTPRRC